LDHKDIMDLSVVASIFIAYMLGDAMIWRFRLQGGALICYNPALVFL